MPVTELSEILSGLGRPIPALGIRRIEDGTRRLDVDDLTAVAQALGVSPITLLLPPASDRSDDTPVTGVEGSVAAEVLWAWLTADRPLPSMQIRTNTFRDDSWPQWRVDELEQLDQELRTHGVKGLGDYQ